MRKTLSVVLASAVAALGVAGCASGGGGDTASASASPKPFTDPGAKAAKVPRRPPVVLMIFDEFPSDTLLGPNRRIDAVRFPNLARLAASGYWFPNATTFYDSTPKAVPLILDGRRPTKGLSADRTGHPRSLYDVFGGRGYAIVDSEEATALCPRRYCRGARRTRPGILKNLRGGRVGRFEHWASKIKRTSRPTAYIKHTLLPHGPYQYLPSGTSTRTTSRDPIPGMNSPPGFGDRFLTQHNYQRYLLQTSFTDREIGKVIRRLQQAGIYDQALIMVTADHGFDWTAGVKDRRRVNRGNVDQVGPVPLFIKAPGQRSGSVQRQYVRTLDIAPTIADILNFRLPYRASGRSAFSRATKRRHTIALPNRPFTRIVRISGRRYNARRRAVTRARLRLFGSGPLARLYTGIGPHRELIGRSAARLGPLPLAKVRAHFVAGRRVHRVRRASGILPSQVAGRIHGGRRGAHRDIAVAVNGRIEAVGRSFYLSGNRAESFAVMVPESSLREGNNSIDVYAVGKRNRLRMIGGS